MHTVYGCMMSMETHDDPNAIIAVGGDKRRENLWGRSPYILRNAARIRAMRPVPCENKRHREVLGPFVSRRVVMNALTSDTDVRQRIPWKAD